jgi:hypothetical protein
VHATLSYIEYEVVEVHWLIYQIFDLDDENNLPTWFSGFLLTNAALVLWSRSQKPGATAHWRWLALGFLLLAIDEVAGLHESFHTAVDFNWTLVAAPVVVGVGAFFVPFLWRLPVRLRWLFVVSGMLFLGGAVGVELLSADMEEESLAYEFAVTVEEGLEMFGVWLFLFALLRSDPTICHFVGTSFLRRYVPRCWKF